MIIEGALLAHLTPLGVPVVTGTVTETLEKPCINLVLQSESEGVILSGGNGKIRCRIRIGTHSPDLAEAKSLMFGVREEMRTFRDSTFDDLQVDDSFPHSFGAQFQDLEFNLWSCYADFVIEYKMEE